MAPALTERHHKHSSIQITSCAPACEGPVTCDDNFGEGRLESEGLHYSPLDTHVLFLVPLLQNQFLISFLDGNLEELVLDFKTDLMSVGFDMVRDMFVLMRHV